MGPEGHSDSNTSAGFFVPWSQARHDRIRGWMRCCRDWCWQQILQFTHKVPQFLFKVLLIIFKDDACHLWRTGEDGVRGEQAAEGHSKLSLDVGKGTTYRVCRGKDSLPQRCPQPWAGNAQVSVERIKTQSDSSKKEQALLPSPLNAEKRGGRQGSPKHSAVSHTLSLVSILSIFDTFPFLRNSHRFSLCKVSFWENKESSV